MLKIAGAKAADGDLPQLLLQSLRTTKSRSRAAAAGYIALFVVLMVGVLGGMFTMLALALCGPLAAVGMDWLYFALMGLLAVLLGAFGSVFNTYSGLYLAKDNDLLLSMPIPVDTLMASRLLSVYLMGFMYSAVVIVPTVIVYWVVVPVTAGAVLGGVLLVAAHLRFRADAVVRAGLGGGENQPEAEEQELHHRARLAGVHRRLLFLLFQGADARRGPAGQRRRVR